MGLRFIIGYEQGCEGEPFGERAVLWDSVTETAFGHTFSRSDDGASPLEEGLAFLDWVEAKTGDGDVRRFRQAVVCALQEEWEEQVTGSSGLFSQDMEDEGTRGVEIVRAVCREIVKAQPKDARDALEAQTGTPSAERGVEEWANALVSLGRILGPT